jgi:GH18 family chitinase
VKTVPTSETSIPAGDGSSFTIQITEPKEKHPGGFSNLDYMRFVIRDARKNNPKIKICLTQVFGGPDIHRIFSNSNVSPEQNAENFADNLMHFLQCFDLDGFDIDWETDLSSDTSQTEFALYVNAIGAKFKQQTDKHYFFTLSPAEVGNLDASAVNSNMDFVNLQLYSGFTDPEAFTQAGVENLNQSINNQLDFKLRKKPSTITKQISATASLRTGG